MALETYNPNDVARITGSDTQVDAGFTKANIQDTVCNFQIGDIFVIPKDFVVYKHDMGNGVFAEYTLIELHGELKQLYPSVFTKRRRVVEKDGSLTKIIASTKGTVAKEFMRHSTVQEAMEAIAGQQIKVSDANEVLCLKWKSTDQTYTSIYTFDFVETPAEEAPVEEVASVEEL